MSWSVSSRSGSWRSLWGTSISADPAAIDRLLVALFLEARGTAPEEIVLDFDATDDPLHGA